MISMSISSSEIPESELVSASTSQNMTHARAYHRPVPLLLHRRPYPCRRSTHCHHRKIRSQTTWSIVKSERERLRWLSGVVRLEAEPGESAVQRRWLI